MPEAGIGRAQHVLAQDGAVRVHERERGVVADGADIAAMVRQPLQLGHQRAQIARPWRDFDVQGRLDRMREGEPIGDGAVARPRAASFAARSIVAPVISNSMPLCT